MQLIGNPGRAVAVALLAALPLADAARADTLDVPAQCATIQAAIVAAEPGDTVLVAPGTYVETIDFLSKAITVESSGGAEVTTIDGNGGGSVVSFVTGEEPTSVLRGFTITGGTGSHYEPALTLVGGGVRAIETNPTVRECVITGNTAGLGGALFVTGNGVHTPLVIENCDIVENSSTVGGGGLAADYAAGLDVLGCTLAGNTTAGNGGGFRVTRGSSLRLFDSVIEDNSAAQLGGGGRYTSDAYGFWPFLEVLRCTVAGNTAVSGGGLSVILTDDGISNQYANIFNCRFEDNHATDSGGGIWANGSFVLQGVKIRNCLLAGNTAGTSGGGVRALGSSDRLSACTIIDNQAPVGGGLYSTGGGGSLNGCILWGNAVGQIAGSLPWTTWCDVQGGASGPGNFDIDPFFANPEAGDYHLSPTSACVDAGDPIYNSGGLETDLDGDPRVLFGRIDVGADEATFSKGAWTFLGHALAGAGGAPSLVGTGTLLGGTPMTLVLGGAAPSSPTWLVLGTGQLLLPFKGGVLVPTIDMLIGPIGSGPAGGWAFNANWPPGLPTGFVVRLQSWIADASGPAGFAASNGLAAQSQ
jgi:predicted outer membrane repeat protein